MKQPNNKISTCCNGQCQCKETTLDRKLKLDDKRKQLPKNERLPKTDRRKGKGL